MSTTMRAVRVERPGVAGLVTIERPEPGAGEVLVAVTAVGICGSDVELLDGSRPAQYVRLAKAARSVRRCCPTCRPSPKPAPRL